MAKNVPQVRRFAGSTLCALTVGVLVTVGHPVQAEPSGRNLALSCFSCHGPAGRSPDSIPAINGKSAPYLARAMNDFRLGKRKSTVMQRIAKGYSAAEINRLAAYVSTLGKGDAR